MSGIAAFRLIQRFPEGSLYRFAFLVSNSAGGLAGRLAGALALAAAALESGSLQISLVDRCDVLQNEHLFRLELQAQPTIIISISYIAEFFK